jgi:hypothetical protein
LISRREAEIRELLDEARGYHDPELVDEITCKIHDCLVVYRRAMRAHTFTFSDGVTRNLTAMALSHAAAQVAEEFGDEATDMEEY